MEAGFLEIPVSVTYNPPSLGFHKWSGNGVTAKYWPTNEPQFETHIGTKLILNQATPKRVLINPKWFWFFELKTTKI
jgi:hypothetical protein